VVELETLEHDDADERRIPTGLPGVDRVLGGGLVPSAVVLLAAEPGISKYISAARRGACAQPVASVARRPDRGSGTASRRSARP
jgi:replicative DNA helicase